MRRRNPKMFLINQESILEQAKEMDKTIKSLETRYLPDFTLAYIDLYICI